MVDNHRDIDESDESRIQAEPRSISSRFTRSATHVLYGWLQIFMDWLCDYEIFNPGLTPPPCGMVNRKRDPSHGCGFLLYIGHGGTTTRSVMKVPANTIHMAR